MKRWHQGGTYRGKTGPKSRPVCPGCGKKGMGVWKPVVYPGLTPCWVRECRYCRKTERMDQHENPAVQREREEAHLLATTCFYCGDPAMPETYGFDPRCERHHDV